MAQNIAILNMAKFGKGIMIGAKIFVGLLSVVPAQSDLLPAPTPNENIDRAESDRTAFADYITRRGNLDAALNLALTPDTSVDPRFKAWAEFIQYAKNIKDGKERAEVVNGWINTKIIFDNSKIFATWKSPWEQTPQTTLTSGKGVCIDIALLKYETLLRTGFKPKDIQLIDADIQYPGNVPVGHHAITTVRIGKNTWVLNDQHAQYSNTIASRMGAFNYNATLEPAEDFFNGSGSYFMKNTLITAVAKIDGKGKLEIPHSDLGIRPANTTYKLKSEFPSAQLPDTMVSKDLNDRQIQNIISSSYSDAPPLDNTTSNLLITVAIRTTAHFAPSAKPLVIALR